MKAEELEIRRRLWATHPCFGKYCDDGELQCGAFLPPIDFLRDDLLDIAKKIAKHSVEQVIEARKAGIQGVVEWLEESCACFKPNEDGTSLIAGWQSQKEEWGI